MGNVSEWKWKPTWDNKCIIADLLYAIMEWFIKVKEIPMIGKSYLNFTTWTEVRHCYALTQALMIRPQRSNNYEKVKRRKIQLNNTTFENFGNKENSKK